MEGDGNYRAEEYYEGDGGLGYVYLPDVDQDDSPEGRLDGDRHLPTRRRGLPLFLFFVQEQEVRQEGLDAGVCQSEALKIEINLECGTGILELVKDACNNWNGCFLFPPASFSLRHDLLYCIVVIS